MATTGKVGTKSSDSKPPPQQRGGSRRLARTVDASTLTTVASPTIARMARERATSFSPASEELVDLAKTSLPNFVGQPRTLSDVVDGKERGPRRFTKQESSSRLANLVMRSIEIDSVQTKEATIVASSSEESTSLSSVEPDHSSSASENPPQAPDTNSPAAMALAGLPARTKKKKPFGQDWPLHVLGLALYDTPVGFSDINSARARNGLATAEEYARDLFSFPHNAVRAQLVDLHDMLQGIVRRSRSMSGRVRKPTSRVDDESFLTWWNTFAAFLATYFGIEEQILFPLAQPSRNTTALEATHLREIMTGFWERRAALKDTVATVSESVESLFVLPMHKVFLDIANCIDQLVPPLLDYMDRQESVLPQYISKSFPSFDIRSLEQSRSATEQRIADYVMTKSANPRSDICSLGIWLNKTDERSIRWKKNVFRGTRKVMYPLWEARYLRTHKAAVDRVAKPESSAKDAGRKNSVRATRSEAARVAVRVG